MVACPDVCVENGGKWVLFRHQVNEMKERLSFKMGVKFAARLYVVEFFRYIVRNMR